MEMLVLAAILSSVGFLTILYKRDKAEQIRKYEALDAENLDNNTPYDLLKIPTISTSGTPGTPHFNPPAYLYYEENPETEATHVLDTGKQYSWESKLLVNPLVPKETLQPSGLLEKQIDDNTRD